MPLNKVDRRLLWFLVYPLLGYCLWTKFAVYITFHPLQGSTLIDFMRMNVAFYGAIAVWCTFMLGGQYRVILRIAVVTSALLFAVIDMSFSAGILHTGSLAPYDVSYFAGQSIGKLTLSIAATEKLTMILIPALFLGSALWRLRRLKRTGQPHWLGYSTSFALLSILAAAPNLNTGAEANLIRPAYVYQVGRYMDDHSIWPQAQAQAAMESAPPQKLMTTPGERPNIVIITLESVGAPATGPYNPKRQAVTPILNELANSSLQVEHAYSVVPHTSKALVAINCGVTPLLRHPIFESTLGIHQPCMAELLSDAGYNTAFFQSPTEHFENRRGLVTNMGYQDFTAHEQMDHQGFELVNYFGYEDDILLKPSEDWLRKQEAPFLAFYLTGTTHHPYLPPTSLPRQTFADDPLKNDYLNALHYLDRFIGKLIQQYRDLGLYENTIFLIVGDHGESLGEHPRLQHNVSLYQEVMSIPLLIHAPGRLTSDQTITLASQLDIMPTLLGLAGFELEQPTEGINLLQPDQHRDLAIAACWYEQWCIAGSDGRFKLIHNFSEKPDELYDLQADPGETVNLAASQPERVEHYRDQLLQYHERQQQLWHQYLSDQDIDYWKKRDATTGTPIGLMNMAQDDPRRDKRS